MSMYSDAENNSSETSQRELLSPEPFRSLRDQFAANLALQGFFQRLFNLQQRIYLRYAGQAIFVFGLRPAKRQYANDDVENPVREICTPGSVGVRATSWVALLPGRAGSLALYATGIHFFVGG